MTKKLLGTLFSIVLPAVMLQAAAPRATDTLRDRIQCAHERMVILNNMFDVNAPADKEYALSDLCGGRKIKTPKWFPEELARMEENKVVYVPDQKQTLSEVDLWRQAFANIGLYLERADDSLNPSKTMVINQLVRGYVGNRLFFMATLDRLNKDLLRNNKLVVMKDSMGGRGRAMLATLKLINDEIFSTIESFTSPLSEQEKKYRQSVKAVVLLSNHLFGQFFGPEVTMQIPDPKVYQTTNANQIMTLVMVILGALFAGLFVYSLLEIKRDSILKAYDDFHAKSIVWAEDFNRQFITIDVKYIVLGTVCLFGLFGVFLGWNVGGFLGVFLFLICVLIGGFVGVRIPEKVLESLKRSRGIRVNKQLMDALILLSNSLRSGMDIVQGFELVSKDMLPPISDEFGLVVKNYQLGTPFEQALDGLTERVDSRMLSYVVKAIIIQRQVGGNLTVIFARLVENIREESKLEEKLQAMTAQQKIQSIVVSIMPFVMMGVMFIFNPTQMFSFYTSFIGIFVFVFCCVWIGIGMMILRKMGDVRV